MFISPDDIKDGMLQKFYIHEALNRLPQIYAEEMAAVERCRETRRSELHYTQPASGNNKIAPLCTQNRTLWPPHRNATE